MVRIFIYKLIARISSYFKIVTRDWENQSLIIQSRILMSSSSWMQSIENGSSIEDKEFKVYSQWGDDGIIQFLVKELEIENRSFVEFGVADFYESNSHFLLINNNWSGLVIDGSKKNINRLKSTDLFWRHDLQAICAFIDKDNIMDLISSKINTEIGLLHIDLDGNDYWILQALDFETLSPDIVILEYNYIFGHERKISIPYDESFHRFKLHPSGLFFGASISALKDAMASKSYIFIGTNSARNNAYFIKEQYRTRIPEEEIGFKHVDAKFRISRDENGTLNFLTNNEIQKELTNLKVFNVETKKLENF